MKSLKDTILESQEKAIVITLPSSINWEDYEKELKAVEDESQVMNFKVPFLPPKTDRDYIKKCYLCYKGNIIGWQKVCGFQENGSLDCTTTGKHWEGNFIQRTGKFNKLDEPIQMKGFQGWRYMK